MLHIKYPISGGLDATALQIWSFVIPGLRESCLFHFMQSNVIIYIRGRIKLSGSSTMHIALLNLFRNQIILQPIAKYQNPIWSMHIIIPYQIKRTPIKCSHININSIMDPGILQLQAPPLPLCSSLKLNLNLVRIICHASMPS